MIKTIAFAFIIIILSIIFLYANNVGYFKHKIEYKSGAWYPDLGFRLNRIFIWKDGRIVYYDKWMDSLNGKSEWLKKYHSALAKQWIEQQKIKK